MPKVVGQLLNVKQTEVDFGSTPVYFKEFTVTDTDVSASSQIVAQLSYEAPTSKSLDEVEFEQFIFKCKPAAGSFVLRVESINGRVRDKFKVNYAVG